jgi:enterochelin esterase-like enzyme
MNPRAFLRFTLAALLGMSLAVAAESTVPANSNAPAAPGKNSGKGKGPKGLRPDFWAGTLNFGGAFSNRGIEGFKHASLVSRKINNKGAGDTEVGYTVYLPPDYTTSGKRYPVLYFLHGLGGNENTVTPVVEKAHALISRNELPPFIIVSAATGRGFYGNQFEGKLQIHDFYIAEFIPHIDQTYRTKTDRRHRHIAGFSMGGYGALMYALKHLDLFGTATDIGGALGAARNNGWKEMYDAKEEHYRPFDLHKLTDDHLVRLKQGDLRIAIWIGSEDMVKGSNVQYHALLDEKGVAHRYHDWNNRPQLLGVGHQLPRYFEVCGKEILQFHAEAFEK